MRYNIIRIIQFFNELCFVQAEGRDISIELIERFAFYDRAKQAFAVVATGEGALYGNIILKKGILPPE